MWYVVLSNLQSIRTKYFLGPGGRRPRPGQVSDADAVRDAGAARRLRDGQLDDDVGADGDARQGDGQRLLHGGRRARPRGPGRFHK